VGAAQRVPASGGVGVASGEKVATRPTASTGIRNYARFRRLPITGDRTYLRTPVLVGPPERAPAGRRAAHSMRELSGGVHCALMIGASPRAPDMLRQASPFAGLSRACRLRSAALPMRRRSAATYLWSGDGGNRARVRDRVQDGVYERSRRSGSHPSLASPAGLRRASLIGVSPRSAQAGVPGVSLLSDSACSRRRLRVPRLGPSVC
jgi:hypothetical protein